MPAIISENSKDSPNTKPIQAIISFSTSGRIKPLFLCIDGITLKVESYTERVEFGSSTFMCNVIDNEIMKTIKVRYHRNENLWTIPLT